ncbi:MAG: hypothetical protein M1150_01125 [Patescibacteria group bacterium]|nr:hypothetical protein [Patescibacteria group bacterium]
MKEDFETVFEKSIELKKQGNSSERIAQFYPQYKEELLELLPLVEILSTQGKKLSPSAMSFDKTLTRMTELSSERNSIFSFYPINLWRNASMLKNLPLKMALPVGLAMVLALSTVAGAIYYNTRSKTPDLNQTNALSHGKDNSGEKSSQDQAALAKPSNEKEPTNQSITAGNANQVLEKADNSIAEELNQMDQDLKDLDQMKIISENEGGEK